MDDPRELAEEYLQSHGIDQLCGVGREELVEQLNSRIEWANPERIVMFKEALEGLSDVARTVVSLVLNVPDEFYKRGLSRRQLHDYLAFYGQEHKEIWKAFSEIQAFLNADEDVHRREGDRKLVYDWFAARDGEFQLG